MNIDNRYTREEALAGLRAVKASGRVPQSHIEWIDYAIKYIDCTGYVTTEVTNAFKPDEWFVTHKSLSYTTRAQSEEEAINHVRWGIYGNVPMTRLAAFDAFSFGSIFEAAATASRIERNKAEIERTTEHTLFGRRAVSQTAKSRMERMFGRAG